MMWIAKAEWGRKWLIVDYWKRFSKLGPQSGIISLMGWIHFHAIWTWGLAAVRLCRGKGDGEELWPFCKFELTYKPFPLICPYWSAVELGQFLGTSLSSWTSPPFHWRPFITQTVSPQAKLGAQQLAVSPCFWKTLLSSPLCILSCLPSFPGFYSSK